MPFVGARMHRNALGTETFAVQSHFYHIGVIASAGIADGRNFIDIYT
jgi:hypothetical protein